MTSSSFGALAIGVLGLVEAQSFHELGRFGCNGWTGALLDQSIDIATTFDALAASRRQSMPIDFGL